MRLLGNMRKSANRILSAPCILCLDDNSPKMRCFVQMNSSPKSASYISGRSSEVRKLSKGVQFINNLLFQKKLASLFSGVRSTLQWSTIRIALLCLRTIVHHREHRFRASRALARQRLTERRGKGVKPKGIRKRPTRRDIL